MGSLDTLERLVDDTLTHGHNCGYAHAQDEDSELCRKEVAARKKEILPVFRDFLASEKRQAQIEILEWVLNDVERDSDEGSLIDPAEIRDRLTALKKE